MILRINTYILVISALILLGCGPDRSYKNDSSRQTYAEKEKNESLVKVNRYMVNTESKEIENYIRRHGLKVTKTGSGLVYQILKEGNGDTAARGKIVTMEYKVKLITGDIVYSSKEDGPLTFEIGHGGVETGLEEAILNMRMGDEAIIIIPSHLGHGLLGDLKKIPQRSTIIYEVEITNIN